MVRYINLFLPYIKENNNKAIKYKTALNSLIQCIKGENKDDKNNPENQKRNA